MAGKFTFAGKLSKGSFTRCDLYGTILWCSSAEAREIIYELANLKGVVYNQSHRVNRLEHVENIKIIFFCKLNDCKQARSVRI